MDLENYILLIKIMHIKYFRLILNQSITKSISSEKIRKEFYHVLTSARSYVINKDISSKFKHLKFEWTSEDKRCGTKILAEWYGVKYPFLSIKIDVVPCLTIYSWPKSSKRKCPLDKCQYQIIARSIYSNETYLWRISTSIAELIDFQLLNNEQKNVYLILKILRLLNENKIEIDNIKYNEEELITSYMFKNEFYFELVRYPNLKQWINSSLIHRISTILKHLHKHLIIGSINSFYIENYNIINNDDYIKLRSFQIKYIQNIYFKIKQLIKLINEKPIRRYTYSSPSSINPNFSTRIRSLTTTN